MVRKIKRRLLPAFGIALMFIVANAAVSYWSVQTITGNNDRVQRSQNLLEEILAMLVSIKTAETSQRGFLLTGDESFAQRYQASLAELEQRLNRLETLAADEPQQSARIPSLRSEIKDRTDTLQQNLEMRRREGLDSVTRSGTLLLGRNQMEEVLQLIAEIQDEEHRLLAQRLQESRDSVRNITLTFLAANLLGLGLLLGAYYLILRFITERQRSEDALQQAHDELEVRVKERTLDLADANTELERSNRELQDFAYVASHDLQEPLRKIQAFGDRLKTKHSAELNPEAADYLDRMQRAARRMHNLINDLLTFSRVTTKAQPFVKTNLDIVAKEVIDDLEVRLQQSDGRVELSDLPTIEADPLQMRQLLQNLIANALKFHRDGVPPIIRIQGKPSRDGQIGSNGDRNTQRYEITVSDNGIGFDEKYLDRIFTPFQRLHGRGEYEGTGIGLAVCRKIVERHGGTLTAKSRPGEGSTFIVNLPAKQD